MKQIDNYIVEKLHINKNSKYHPEIDNKLYLPLSSEKILDIVELLIKDKFSSTFQPIVDSVEIIDITEPKDGHMEFKIKVTNTKKQHIQTSLFSDFASELEQLFDGKLNTNDYKYITCLPGKDDEYSWEINVMLDEEL